MRKFAIVCAAVLAVFLLWQSSTRGEAAEGKKSSAALKGEHSKKTQTKWFIDHSLSVRKSRGNKEPKVKTKCAPVGSSGVGQAC
jgi:hypothetical protein